jgi:hypothetical protein
MASRKVPQRQKSTLLKGKGEADLSSDCRVEESTKISVSELPSRCIRPYLMVYIQSTGHVKFTC